MSKDEERPGVPLLNQVPSQQGKGKIPQLSWYLVGQSTLFSCDLIHSLSFENRLYVYGSQSYIFSLNLFYKLCIVKTLLGISPWNIIGISASTHRKRAYQSSSSQHTALSTQLLKPGDHLWFLSFFHCYQIQSNSSENSIISNYKIYIKSDRFPPSLLPPPKSKPPPSLIQTLL